MIMIMHNEKQYMHVDYMGADTWHTQYSAHTFIEVQQGLYHVYQVYMPNACQPAAPCAISAYVLAPAVHSTCPKLLAMSSRMLL